MRLDQPKPEDVYRSWRSLAKELQNPATIRKAKACSRANGSRLNFGRTGPSCEVGVRNRLKKQYRRSPNPDEVQFEMARDKGYGGLSKRKLESDNIIHEEQGSKASSGISNPKSNSRARLESHRRKFPADTISCTSSR